MCQYTARRPHTCGICVKLRNLLTIHYRKVSAMTKLKSSKLLRKQNVIQYKRSEVTAKVYENAAGTYLKRLTPKAKTDVPKKSRYSLRNERTDHRIYASAIKDCEISLSRCDAPICNNSSYSKRVDKNVGKHFNKGTSTRSCKGKAIRANEASHSEQTETPNNSVLASNWSVLLKAYSRSIADRMKQTLQSDKNAIAHERKNPPKTGSDNSHDVTSTDINMKHESNLTESEYEIISGDVIHNNSLASTINETRDSHENEIMSDFDDHDGNDVFMDGNDGSDYDVNTPDFVSNSSNLGQDTSCVLKQENISMDQVHPKKDEICTGTTKRKPKKKKKNYYKYLSHDVSEQPPYKCTRCEAVFNTTWRRNRHVRLRHEKARMVEIEKPYACVVCNSNVCIDQQHATQERNFKSLVRYHQFEHLAKHKDTSNGMERIIHKCIVCSEKFQTALPCRKHTLKHGVDTLKLTSESAKVQSTFENSPYVTYDDYVSRSYPCKWCGETFSERHLWVKHRRKVHMDGDRYKCPHCTYTASKAKTLTAHIYKHQDGSRYCCTVCGLQFKVLLDLNNHLLKNPTHGTPTRLYECSQCDKKFTYSYGLLRHKRTHTAEKPLFPCPLCGHVSKAKLDMERHMAGVHKSGGVVKCKHCDYTHGLKTMVRMHIRKKHPEQRMYTEKEGYRVCNLCNWSSQCVYSMTQHLAIQHDWDNQLFVCIDQIEGQ